MASSTTLATTACRDPSEVSASPQAAATPESVRAGLGVHSLVFNRDGIPVVPLRTPAMRTRATGSAMLVCVGRGIASTHALPEDNRGNVYAQIGSNRAYTLWPDSGTALYLCANLSGGARHVVSVAKSQPRDETTLSVVEVVDAGALGEVKWNEVLFGGPTTSGSVTTSGPALIVAWWWGDGGARFDKKAVPDNGFKLIGTVGRAGDLVQCAVAFRKVEAAGSYQVTWTSSPAQGAQMWIAVIEAAR